MALSNSEIASALGMSHSSVSRMRAGARVASIETLQKLVDSYDADPRKLLETAAKAIDGNAGPWCDYLASLFGSLGDGDSESTREAVESPV